MVAHKIAESKSDPWFAHHLEMLNQMFRDEFRQYSDEARLRLDGYAQIQAIIKGGEKDTTFDRIIGYDRSESRSKPLGVTLNSFFSYFVKNETSPYNQIAKKVKDWSGFVKFIDDTFDHPVFQKKRPPRYDRGRSAEELEVFDVWYDQCKQVIVTEVLPALKSFAPLQTSKSNELANVYQVPASNEIFEIIDHIFWKRYKSKKSKHELIDYYLNADTERLLPYVIMFDDGSGSELYIAPDKEFEIIDEIEGRKSNASIDTIMTPGRGEKSLIKILSDGGEGKSTFLLHLSKEYFVTHDIIKIRVNTEVDNIVSHLPLFTNGRSVIILLDNAMNHKGSLERYTNAFDLMYGELGFVVVLAERVTTYEPISYFERRYDGVYRINYKISPLKQERFFETIWELLDLKSSTEDVAGFKREFLSSNLPLRKKVKGLLSAQGITTKYGILEDWQEWEAFINKHQEYVNLRRLYLVVALFNKFGLSVPVKFRMLTFPYGGDSILIKNALSKPVSPLFTTEKIGSEEYLRLRHDTAADDFFLVESHRDDAVDILKDFFVAISDKYSASLFRNLQEHQEFDNDPYFKNLLSVEARVTLLANYYHRTEEIEERGKTLIRLSVLLTRLERFDEAIDLLRKSDDVYAKTLLASIVLRPEYNRIEEAEKLLIDVLESDRGNIYALEKILHLYAKGNSDKAKIDNVMRQLPEEMTDGKIVTRLSVLLIKLERYDEAIELLEDFLAISNNPYAKTLLASLFMRPEFNRIDEAEALLFQVLEDDSRNITAIEKLLHIYSKARRDKVQLHKFIDQIPQDLKKTKELLEMIIICQISVGSLIEAYHNDKSYLKNYPNESNLFFISRINLKPDRHKNTLFNYCLKQKDLEFSELVLGAIQDKSHISYSICLAKLLIGQERQVDALTLLEDLRINAPLNIVNRDKTSRSILSLLISIYHDLKYDEKRTDAIIDFMKIYSYDNQIRAAFEGLVYSAYVFTDNQFFEVEKLFQLRIKERNLIGDKKILIRVYKGWLLANLNRIMNYNKTDKSRLDIAFNILNRAKMLVKTESNLRLHLRELINIEKKYMELLRRPF